MKHEGERLKAGAAGSKAAGGGNCLGTSPKEKGAWCVQALERKPVCLHTHTHFYHPLDTAASPTSLSLQVQFEPPPTLATFHSNSHTHPNASHTLCLCYSESFQVAPALEIKTQLQSLFLAAAAAVCFADTHDYPHEALARSRPSGQAPYWPLELPLSPGGPWIQAEKEPTSPRKSSLIAPKHSAHSHWEPAETSLG